jgi:cell wall-associated NlpC family hydrolase
MRPTLPHHPNTGWLRRRSARLLAGTTLAITGCLAIAVPAHAAAVGVTSSPAHAALSSAASLDSASSVSSAATLISATTASASTSVPSSLTAAAAASDTHQQMLTVSDDATTTHLVEESFLSTPPDVPALLQQAAPQTDPTTLASTASALGAMPGQRLQIVGTALSYLGTPYVLGGASHSGIDCSGLVMEAYQAVGMSFAHIVSGEDAMGHEVSAADAKPGDLLVFDNEKHIAIYLGNGLLIAAREPGTDVQIESLSNWSGIGYHFTRVLGD